MTEIWKLTKIGVAVDQLDGAIRMLIDHSAYIPAIALAGGAEEILGKVVGKQASFHCLKGVLSKRYNVDEKVVADDHLRDL